MIGYGDTIHIHLICGHHLVMIVGDIVTSVGITTVGTVGDGTDTMEITGVGDKE
tara:strand:- start:1185 stop:1346 length:162 start_codon:yes stop_codon:yes gene_type:complete